MAKWFLTRVQDYNGGKKQPLQKSLLEKKKTITEY